MQGRWTRGPSFRAVKPLFSWSFLPVDPHTKTKTFRFPHRSDFLYQIIAWSVLIVVSLLWNSYQSHQDNLEKARIQARTLYELTLAYRGWAAFHGGVYVPVSETFQPNPYLSVPERDVTTTTGEKLTLINPAWMTRQVFERLGKQSDMPIINHMTSLKYLNPGNKPDAWEEKGLRAFEQGTPEISEAVSMNGQPYLRMLKPFVTQKECLKCHAHQGYKEGDIRGGISIAIPMRPYLATEMAETRSMIITYALFWAIGMGGIVVLSRRIQNKQKELVDSEEKYRLLFENNPHPMWVYDSETLSFLTVNDAAVQHYGYSKEEFLSMTIKDIRFPEDVPGLLKEVSRAADGVDRSGVWRHRKKDGSTIFVEITTHTLDFAGKHAKLVLAHDVTERQKLEDQLRHGQKMEAVGKLAGGVAHDFNNILTAIIGYGSLVLMKMRPEEPMRHNVEEILAAAQRAANLTQGLLTFSRRQIGNPGPVNVNQVIERVGKLLVRVIGEDIRFEAKLADGDLIVTADSGQLDQVLMNLATNARDAMPNGGILNIETRRVELDDRFIHAHHYGKRGSYAVIAITDSGTGMDAKIVERIFDPFFTTKETGQGTGLGLSLVYGIVKQNHGYINVYSEPGKGTTFKIYLPMAAAAAEAWKTERSEVLKRGAEIVLMAEDDEAIRRLVRSVLGEFGYTVIEAIDGEDAIEKIRQHRENIQLLLLDVIMPKKNGREVYVEARKLMPSVRALFLSGYTADIVQKRGLLDEGQEFIAKPVSPSELLRKIRDVLDRAPGV